MNAFGDDVPLGLGMALAQNVSALERFSALSDSQRQAFVAGAGAVNSKEEMKRYVEKLSQRGFPGGTAV